MFDVTIIINEKLIFFKLSKALEAVPVMLVQLEDLNFLFKSYKIESSFNCTFKTEYLQTFRRYAS